MNADPFTIGRTSSGMELLTHTPSGASTFRHPYLTPAQWEAGQAAFRAKWSKGGDLFTYHAELTANGQAKRYGMSLAQVEKRTLSLENGPAYQITCDGEVLSEWSALTVALQRFAAAVERRKEAIARPIREAEALAARIAASVDLARVIDLLESAAASLGEWDDREEHPLALELRAAVAKLRADGVTL